MGVVIAVGLDLSLVSTGWAVWGADVGRVRTDLAQHRGLEGTERRAYIAASLAAAVYEGCWDGQTYRDCLVVIEKSYVGTPNVKTALDLAMLHAVVLHVFGDVLAPAVAYVMPSTSKKHLAGKGGASKDDMIAAAQRCGYGGSQTDEADAYGLALLGHHLLGGTDHLTPHRASCLAAVEWVVPLPETAVTPVTCTETTAEKVCCVCRLAKPVDAFSKNKHRPDGFRGECRACNNTQQNARRAASDDTRGRTVPRPTEDPLAEWKDEALCRNVDPALFFPEGGESPDGAKEVCRGCPVVEECLRYALANHEFGVWGGTTERDRRRMRRAKRWLS